MIKAEKAQEITRKLKRMGEENQVEDEVEKADRMAGLGYKINNKIFDKMDSRLIDPNKNFYKLDGENMQELEHLKSKTAASKLSKRISKKRTQNSASNQDSSKKIKFVRRNKAERKARKSKIPKGKKMN
jgi:NAD-dependent DNA ligase